MSDRVYHKLREQLAYLKLGAVAEQLAGALEAAERDKPGYTRFLHDLLDVEVTAWKRSLSFVPSSFDGPTQRSISGPISPPVHLNPPSRGPAQVELIAPGTRSSFESARRYSGTELRLQLGSACCKLAAIATEEARTVATTVTRIPDEVLHGAKAIASLQG
ncbi:MAG: hypothetical protein ACRDLA_11495, partial [Thermoleophilaceae bacterium]